MTEHAVRFHQAVTFLPTLQIVPLAKASDDLGYDGIYVSDHLFNPRDLESRYTYSTREDGAPAGAHETRVARPDVPDLRPGRRRPRTCSSRPGSTSRRCAT